MSTSETGDSILQIAEYRPYIKAGVIGLAGIWVLVILYLLFWPATYTSTWGLMVMSTDSVNVNLQNIGTTSADSSRLAEYQDPRDDYIYLALSLDTLTAAAKRMDMEIEDYGEPVITADADSAIIEFEVEGKSAEEAKEKSIVLYDILSAKIARLRQEEADRRLNETMSALEEDQAFLNTSQLKIADFKSESSYRSDDQIKTLSSSIEELRAGKSEQIAQLKGLENKLEQLSRNSSIDAQEMLEAYLLQADPVYQAQLEQYGGVASDHLTLRSALGERHPELLSKQAEMSSIVSAMANRAQFLLNRELSEKDIILLSSRLADPLAQEWANTNIEYLSQQASITEMDNQISILEVRLKMLDQEKIALSGVQADFLVAESVLASTIARLSLNDGGINSIYPPVQLVVAPNLPDDQTSPDLKIGILVGAAISFMFVAMLVFLIWEKNSPWRNPRAWIP